MSDQRILPHCQPDHWRGGEAPHALVCDWPQDARVQWGGHGLVIGAKPYMTAFFEAFLPVEGFIRGEGETIAAAERAAWALLERDRACPRHQWTRRGYRNGLGFCRFCGASRSGVFRPIVTLGTWREPVTWHWVGLLGETVERPDDPGDRRRRLRLKHFGAAPRPSIGESHE